MKRELDNKLNAAVFHLSEFYRPTEIGKIIGETGGAVNSRINAFVRMQMKQTHVIEFDGLDKRVLWRLYRGGINTKEQAADVLHCAKPLEGMGPKSRSILAAWLMSLANVERRARPAGQMAGGPLWKEEHGSRSIDRGRQAR